MAYRFLQLTHNTRLISLRACALLFAASLIVGTVSYMLIEGFAFHEALYMAVITISTVGFGEVHPLSDGGRMFTSVFVIINLGITALFISQLTQHLSEGGLATRLRNRMMNKELKDLQHHIIVCGAGRYGREIIEQLTITEETIVLVERDAERINLIASSHPKLLYVEADATTDEGLLRAGIERAKAMIVTLGSDSDNTFAVLTARQFAPKKLVIIARTYNPESRSKMMRVGADHVVQPEQIGGFFMSALVRKPSAVEFFTTLAKGPTSDIGFEEIHQERLPKALQACSLREMDLRRSTGVSVVALRYADGHYEVNPDPTRTLAGSTSMIALGDRAQLDKLRALLKPEHD